jgi:NAD(P)-dependent dehydrogenase (short-subunit alcohol dehydrogenase family)
MGITDELRLDGRTIVVTGAGGKIGSTCALVLAEAGARVALVDVDPVRLDAVSERLRAGGSEHIALAADTADPDAFAAAAARAVERFGPPDGLLCLVGGVHPEEFGPFIGNGIRTYDAMVDRNLRSAVVAHEIVAGLMVDADHAGSLVSITAATALASAPFHALYGAAKAALIAMARTLAVEWGPLGIRVNTIAPGGVETFPPKDLEEMARTERATIPLGRRVVPREIAATALFLLSDLSSAITGQTIVLDGGALAKPSFIDADNVPVFVTDKALRDRMRDRATKRR